MDNITTTMCVVVDAPSNVWYTYRQWVLNTGVHVFQVFPVYCEYCEYSQYFGVPTACTASILRVLAVFRGWILLWILSVLQVFRGSILGILQISQVFRGSILRGYRHGNWGVLDTDGWEEHFNVK